MMEPRSREGDSASGLRVERVDLVPTDLGVVLVRVSGRWEGDPSPAVALLVGDRRFDPLPETSGAAARAASGADAFRATFSIADELRPALGGDVRLAVGDQEVELPVARDTVTGAAEPAGAKVVDRAVLAERRARRAELAEETIARRAEEAEVALAELEGELAKLELRLERSTDERAELRSQLADALRDARAAAQRAEAERRRREEAIAEAAERADGAEEEADRLHERADAAGEHARGLSREVESLRRRVAEAEHAAAAAQAARARAEELAQTAESAASARIAQERTATAVRRAKTLSGESELAARARDAGPPAARPVAAPDVEAMRALIAAESRVVRARREPGDNALRDEARHAAAAVAEAAWTVVEARDALGGASGAVEAERALRAAADAERDVLARELAAERQGAARLGAEIQRRAAVQERAERAIGELRARVEELQGLSARVQRADEAESALREYASAAGEALEEAERRIGEARDAAAGMQDRLAKDRAEHERVERELREELAAHVEAAMVERSEPAPAQAAEPAPPAAPRAPARRRREERREPWLPAALRRFAAADPQAAIRLGVQLLPAQALGAEDPLDYDLLADGLGWHAVALRKGGRGTVATLPSPRPRRRTDLRLAADAPALAELLAAGGSREVRRAGRARVRGTLRRRRALRRLPAAPLDLADLAEAGIWPDPGLVLAALSHLLDPAWTEGEPLVVALEVVGPRGGRWAVDAPGGEPLAVTAGRPQDPSATVRMPQAAFQSLLAGRPGATDGKAAIRGDVAALARLVEWMERAQRETS